MGNRSLRRRVDHVEDAAAWLLTVAAIIVVITAGLVGCGRYGQGMEQVRAEQASRVQVDAVLLEDAAQVPSRRGSVSPYLHASARWIDEAGRQHEGQVMVRPQAHAGERVAVWLDDHGKLVPQPADRTNAVRDGLVVAVTLLVLGGALVGAAWAGLRRVIFAHNTRTWEQEWARVGPEWTSQQPK
jgi:hypothetical protein